jgi:hypothetical protein
MLIAFRSSCLSCALTAARAVARFDLVVANCVRLILTVAGTEAERVTTGEDTRGTGTGLRSGRGSGATFAALPMPLGSLIEPLSPRAFAGPGAMPLTPASWAGDPTGGARIERTANASNISRPRWKIGPGRGCSINRLIPCALPIRLSTEQLGRTGGSSLAPV